MEQDKDLSNQSNSSIRCIYQIGSILSARLDIDRQKAKQFIRNHGNYIFQGFIPFKILIFLKKKKIISIFSGVVRVRSLDSINSKVFINKVNTKEANELDMEKFLLNSILSTEDQIPYSIRPSASVT